MANILARFGLVNLPPRGYLGRFMQRMYEERRQNSAEMGETSTAKRVGFQPSTDHDKQGPKDFLARFIESHDKDPEHFAREEILRGMSANIVAGSDTTAITLAATIFHLVKNQRSLVRLRQEIASHVQAGTLSQPPTLRESHEMVYLQAVIKEAMRLHPVIGLPLPRVVPNGGAYLCDRFFPAGTVVGVNPWLAHHNTDGFGADVADFRPERWLKSETDETTLARMEHSYMPFGLGGPDVFGPECCNACC